MTKEEATTVAAASKVAYGAGDYAEAARLAGTLREWASAQGKQINQGTDGTLKLGDGGTGPEEGDAI